MIAKHKILTSIPVCAFVALSCIAAPAFAAIYGMVTGKVVDNNGKGIGNVEITLVSEEGRNPDRVVTSNKRGMYRVTNVNPGNYEIIAEVEGYRHQNPVGFRVSANSRINLDLFMDPVVQADPGSEHFDGEDEETEDESSPVSESSG